MPEQHHSPAERATEHRYSVRQVTAVQASWTERSRGEPGHFTVQLILDRGVEEYILAVAAEDMEPLLRLFRTSDHAHFDLERKVLMFPNLVVK